MGVWFAFHEQLWGGSNELEVRTGDVEEVGRRVRGSKLTVYVERMKSCRTRDAVRGHSLDNRPALDLFLKGDNVGLVAILADVRFTPLIWGYWRLRRKWYFCCL